MLLRNNLLISREWRNWQTRTFEGRVVTPYGFKSRLSHQKLLTNTVSNFIKILFRVRPMKKLTFIILSILMIVCTLTSCESTFTPCEFYQKGMTVTLDTSFNRALAGDYTCCYQSPRAAVYGLKEEFGEALTEETTLQEYASKVLQANGITASVEEKGTYLRFVYETEQVNVQYTYEVCLYKAGDAFWMIQFACPTDSYENQKADIESWAKSVVFS